MRLKIFFDAKYPNFFKSVNHFQKEKANSALRYFRTDNQNNIIKRTPRIAHLDVVK